MYTNGVVLLKRLSWFGDFGGWGWLAGRDNGGFEGLARDPLAELTCLLGPFLDNLLGLLLP